MPAARGVNECSADVPATSGERDGNAMSSCVAGGVSEARAPAARQRADSFLADAQDMLSIMAGARGMGG